MDNATFDPTAEKRCLRGHLYSKSSGGHRYCRDCAREATRRCYARARQGKVARRPGRPKIRNCTHAGTADFLDAAGYSRCRTCTNEQRRANALLKREGGWPRPKPITAGKIR